MSLIGFVVMSNILWKGSCSFSDFYLICTIGTKLYLKMRSTYCSSYYIFVLEHRNESNSDNDLHFYIFSFFERESLNLLNECESDDYLNTKGLIISKIPYWDQRTCLR